MTAVSPVAQPRMAAALACGARGWHVFPLGNDTKGSYPDGRSSHLLGDGHKGASCDEAHIRTWWSRWPDANIGLSLAASGLVALDADLYKDDCGWREFVAGLDVPATLTQHSPRGGMHLIFAADPGARFAGQLCAGVDIKHRGYILLAPSTFEGKCYRFGTDCDPAPVPDWVPRRGARTEPSALRADPRDRSVRKPVDRSSGSCGNAKAGAVSELLSWLDPDADGYAAWIEVLQALHDHFGGGPEGLALAEDWSRRGAKHVEGEVASRWAGFTVGGGVTLGTIAARARNAGADLADIARRHRSDKPAPRMCAAQRADTTPATDGPDTHEGLPGHAEDSIALAFAADHRDRMRYVAPWGRWMIWDGARWATDTRLTAFDRVRRACRAEAKRQHADRDKRRIASATTVAAVEKLARSDQRLAADADAWDADPWLLNTPDGVIDLTTGNRQGHRAGDLMTRMTATGPGGTCATWHRFLDDVTGGDEGLQGFLQHLSGYALTGSTREHALAFLHGTGTNGKSVFLNTISGMMGDYHRTAPIETFTASGNFDRHPTDLAMLRGARLVTAIETEEGRSWAESRIKSLTGGDRISARFMRQDFFEYTPQFKLVIAGNHKPGLRSVDEAMRRRIHLVPFAVTFPPGQRDLELSDKLRREWPGILQWAIEGCLAWQSGGLSAPDCVRAATDEYMEAQDGVAAWLNDRCQIDNNAWERTADLFRDWKTWADANGEPALSRARFQDALKARGFSEHRRNTGRGYSGLRLRQIDYSQAHWNR